MINNRKYTNNQDSDDYIFEDEQDFFEDGQDSEERTGQPEAPEEPEIEEIAVTMEEDGEEEANPRKPKPKDPNAGMKDSDPEPNEPKPNEPKSKPKAPGPSEPEKDFFELYDDGEPSGLGKPKRLIPIAAAVVLLAAALAAAGIVIYKLTPSKTRVDYMEYFGVSAGEAVLIYNYEKSDYRVKRQNGCYYVENDFLKEHFTDKFYYDRGRNEVLYTTATEIYTIPVGEPGYSVDGAEKERSVPVAFDEDGVLYIAVEFAAERCDMVWREYAGPDRLVIVDGGSEYIKALLKDEYVIREGAGIKESVLENASDGADTMWMLEDPADGQEWLKVRSEDGRSGYVRSSHTTGASVQYVYDSGVQEAVYPAQTRNYDILLVWHAVYGPEDNQKIEELLANAKGVNAVSPTWYKAADAEGKIESMADRDYVGYIHGLGMEIWPLISDFTSVDGDGWDEKALLCNTDSRRRLIGNIMAEINDYGYDGINIDFEKVPQEAGDGYIQFIRELSIECRKAGVVLSVDNYVPRPYNMQYHRTGQGECVDYVIVMGYDEHYAGGSEAGSVASIGFVDGGISETLKEVPKEKLINAVPFYTRLWIEGADESGNLSLNSKSYGMDGGAAIAEELGLTKTWDDEAGQYVAEGMADGKHYSIWLEDERSMSARMELIRGYQIAGVAAWCLGLESDSVWDIIAEK